MRGAPADLFIKLCGLLVVGRFFSSLCVVASLEDGGQLLQGGGFPLADLVWVDAVFSGDLGQGFVFAQDLLDDLSLEGKRCIVFGLSWW